jgi:hypothetical protein
MSSTSSVGSVGGVTRHGAGAGILPDDGLSRARAGRKGRPLYQAAIAGADGAIRSQGRQAFSSVPVRPASVAAVAHRPLGHGHTRVRRGLKDLSPPLVLGGLSLSTSKRNAVAIGLKRDGGPFFLTEPFHRECVRQDLDVLYAMHFHAFGRDAQTVVAPIGIPGVKRQSSTIVATFGHSDPCLFVIISP